MLTKDVRAAKPVEVSNTTFSQEVLRAPIPVLLDCWAPWCGPCRAMAPVMEELAGTLAGTAMIAKLNVDENPNVAQALGVQSIPTLLLFRNGEVIARIVGAAPRTRIEDEVRRRLRLQ